MSYNFFMESFQLRTISETMDSLSTIINARVKQKNEKSHAFSKVIL